MPAVPARRITQIPGSLPTRLQLFVVPHAGAGASAYRGFRSLLPEDVELCLVHLPGREGRIQEPLLRDMLDLVDDLLPSLQAATAGPYAFFGHSMGAILAFEATMRILATGGQAPRRLFVSAHRAPHLSDPRGPRHMATDEQLLEELARLGGTPPEILAHPELMAMVLPVFRADLEALHSRTNSRLEALPVHITALGGTQDPTVGEPGLAAWQALAPAHGFQLHWFEGGHFYFQDNPAFASFLTKQLQALY